MRTPAVTGQSVRTGIVEVSGAARKRNGSSNVRVYVPGCLSEFVEHFTHPPPTWRANWPVTLRRHDEGTPTVPPPPLRMTASLPLSGLLMYASPRTCRLLVPPTRSGVSP